MKKQTVICGALLCDGTGSAPFSADLFLADDRIVKIGTGSRTGFDEIHAEGLLVCPGFVDVHAHSDLSLLAAPDAFGKISQGVTTEISGNCGLSPFPVTDRNREKLTHTWKNYGIDLTWTDFSGYADRLEKASPAVNAALLCGHNSLRSAVLGYGDEPVTETALTEMKKLLKKMIGQGALGLSTGLLYVPGKFAKTDELQELMSVLKETDSLYATHLRNEGDTLLEALEEAILLAQHGSGKLQVSHLKTALQRNWHKIDALFDAIDRAKAAGVQVTADRYPYTYGQTNLSVILPPPYDRMPDARITETLKNDDAACAALERDLEKEDCWDQIILTGTDGLAGLTVTHAAEKMGVTPARLVVDLVRKDSAGTLAAFGGMSEENMTRIIARDDVFCGTDETARPRDFSIGRSHPRGFGAFPEFLKRNLENGLPLEQIIRRMTGAPAEKFGLKDRGVLREGAFADLVLIDLNKLCARSSFADPHAPAEGIEKVFVNGVLSYADGRVIARAGKVLSIRYG
ncbi:MAG: D-aminoacylase [Lentisphaeria bacterium]|nr:D-aminoacylase [Lentisphaeria bacterium]